MILQSLVKYYEVLAAQGKIGQMGWSPVNVSYAIDLTADGDIQKIESLRQTMTRGKKEVLVPLSMELPTRYKRSSNLCPNFLSDNATYLLGVDIKGNPQRALECFVSARELHKKLLKDINTPAAKAVLRFFASWEPDIAQEHPVLGSMWEEVMGGSNLVFRFEGEYLQDDPQVRAAWQHHFQQSGEGPVYACLVTGEVGPISVLHPSIKGVSGAQSTGASLVSFNAPAFESYGKTQGLNAPTSQYAAFAYTEALNYLLADRAHQLRMGDTTVLCWSEDGSSAAQELFLQAHLDTPSEFYSPEELREMVSKLLKGQPVNYSGEKLDPEKPFYVLGIAPNAARLSVRFFLNNSLGKLLENVTRHHERLELIRPAYVSHATPSLWALLNATVNQKSKDKSPLPGMAGQVLRSILTDTPYPAALYQGIQLRIRSEHDISWCKAAAIKAYFMKCPHPDVPEEVLTVSLNPESTNTPYLLGRLFSILEEIQSRAIPGINTTIKDRFFNSASATPASVFPWLINLCQKHLRKLPAGSRIYFEKQMMEVMDAMDGQFPVRLNLSQQGAFQLGYYHQTQQRYISKNKEAI